MLRALRAYTCTRSKFLCFLFIFEKMDKDVTDSFENISVHTQSYLKYEVTITGGWEAENLERKQIPRFAEKEQG